MRTVRLPGCAAALAAVAVCVLTSPLAAQRALQNEQIRDRRDKLEALTGSTAYPQLKAVAMESTIDPNEYIVGPGDVISVNIWTTPPATYTLPVTPEGTLILPTVGEIRISDFTLHDAKERIHAELRKKYISGAPTVTLVQPREVVVIVQGEVMNPGTYVLPAFARVDRAIEEANVLMPDQGKFALEYLISRMSARHIYVRHKDGSSSVADIPKFRGLKVGRLNPYLREGDVVVVPRKDPLRGAIGVYGEVNGPARFEYSEGDSASHLLRMGFGFTSRAVPDSVALTRLSPDGREMEAVWLNGADLLAGRRPDVSLRPGDRLVVRGRIEERGDFRASIWGEVVSPGFYPITRDRTTVADLVRMAGGFTPYAEPASGTLTRRSTEASAVALERLESLRGGVSPDDSAYYYLETELRLQKEIVNMDFAAVFLRGDSAADVVLRDGDMIVFHDARKTIYVFGQVASPGHVAYVQGQPAEYYIAAAGGLTERAREGDIKVVKARNKQWLSPDESPIEGGDYVWVPKVDERPFGYYLGIVAQSAAIISVAISLYLLVKQ